MNKKVSQNLFLAGKNRKKTSRQIIITDLSRMKNRKICIFGVDSKLNHVRPVIPYEYIYPENLNDANGKKVVEPLTIVELDFVHPYPEIPHKEDYIINPCFKPIFKRKLTDVEAKLLLETIDDGYISNIFNTEIVDGKYIYENQGDRSIGTIKVKKVHKLIYSKNYDKPRITINFSDKKNKRYNLSINDCRFLKFYTNSDLDSEKLNLELKKFLNNNTLYLRIGLSRIYKKEDMIGHWLFVTGLYSFPDYRTAF